LSRPWSEFSFGPVTRTTGGEDPTRLYTRTGDRGETGLAGGARVAKEAPRIRTYGTFDELGAHLGLAESFLPAEATEIAQLLVRLQHELFLAQAELATPPTTKSASHRIEARHVTGLEQEIDRFSSTFEPIHTFVLPRGSKAGAALHVARTVARRAERELWRLHRVEPQRPELLQWANRLSDLLFALALSTNRREGVREIPPDYSV
jgi:cob(I)alamin adenosyltransferase